MKKGLVLEGGAMRGLFTAGALDLFLEKEIHFDGMIGVSAGALFGCSYKSAQKNRSLRYNLKYCRDKSYASLWSLFTTGDMYGSEFCYHTLPEKLDVFDYDTFKRDKTLFYCTCTEVASGKARYFPIESCDRADMEKLRAGASMPFLAREVKIGNESYLDGGIGDSIPLERFESMGYEKNLVILTRPRDYVKKKSGAMKLLKPFLFNKPRLYEAIRDRYIHYNRALELIAKREKEGRVLVIAPKAPLDIKKIERSEDKIRQCWQAGYDAAEEELDRIISFLK